MSQVIIARSDAYRIALPYLAPADRIGGLIDGLVRRKPYQWQPALRHLYVLTWPLSFITRCAMFIVLGTAWLVLGIGGVIAARLTYIWRGERSPWD